MTTHTIELTTIKRLAATAFRHYCEGIRFPSASAPENQLLARLGLGATATTLAQEHQIDLASAMDILMKAWAAEGEAVIDRWDVRAITSLLDAIPEALPTKCRKAGIRAVTMNDQGDWVVCFDSSVPKPRPAPAQDAKLELIASQRGMGDLHESLAQRMGLLVAEHKAGLQAENQRIAIAQSGMPGGFAYSTQVAKEILFRTWMESDQNHPIGHQNGWVTAKVNDLQLVTRPARTMIRPQPFSPYVEVDGLAYAWFDAQGRIRNEKTPWDETKQGDVLATDFDSFASKVAQFIPPGSWQVDSDEPEPDCAPGQDVPR